MGKKEREKGARGERLLRDYLNSFGAAVRRGYVFCRESDLVGLQGIHVECKNVERLNVRDAMDQAIREAEKRKDGLPAVFWHKSRKPWLTIMRTEDFMTIYQMARGMKNEVTEPINTPALTGVRVNNKSTGISDVSDNTFVGPYIRSSQGGTRHRNDQENQ